MHPYLTPFHPLKVTKFLVKISQFNFFDSLLWQRKTFLLINLFRCEIFQILLYFLCKNYSPRWKRSPFYFPATPSKNRGPVKPSPPPLPLFWKFGGRFNSPSFLSPARRECGCTLWETMFLLGEKAVER